MKFIWLLFCCIICFQNNVFATTCNEKLLKLTLDANADTRCSALNIIGQYQAKFCSGADQGTLTDKDATTRFLFKTGDVWMARSDAYDVWNGILDTNMLIMNFSHATFSVEQVKSKSNGTILNRYICYGIIVVIGDHEVLSSSDSH